MENYKRTKICYVVTVPETILAFFVPQLKYLSTHGCDVTVICSSSNNLQTELGRNIKYVPLYIARGISIASMCSSIRSLVKLFKTEQFDMVQYSTPNAAFCASIAAKMAKTRIRNYHLMGLRYLGFTGVSRFVFKQIEKITCSLSTHIECITPSNLEMSVHEGLFPREKATIVGKGSTGGVDIKRFNYENRSLWRKEVRAELSLSEREFVFGFVGRITRDKGINELLTAFLKIDQDCRLLIIGSKEGIKTLDSELWAEAINDERIIILDAVLDIERYYAAMDVLLLPSYREGFGMVIAEAAAVGTPAIVSRIPGPIDVIEEAKTALTVNVKDSDDLADKMRYCINNGFAINKMSEYCPKYIKENYDSRVICKKVYERKIYLLKNE